MRRVPELGVLALCVAVSGCAVGPVVEGHKEFSRGDFSAARVSYEEALERGVDDPEVLLRLAVAYLVTVPEDARAEEILRKIATEDIGGAQRPIASLLLSLRRSLGEAQQEAEAVRQRVAALETELEQRSATIDSLRGEGQDTDATIGQLERSRAQLRRRLAESQELLESEVSKVKALRAELEKLKEIDLGRPPG